MLVSRLTALAGIALAAAAFAVTPAEALTTKECSVKYQAAKEAGTLGDMKWNDFRKTQCAAATADDDDDQAATTKKKKAAAKKDDDDDDAKGLTSKQCSAKYQAAKEAGTLGDMKWNDFRKAQCGPGASAEIEKPAKKKAAAKKDDDDAKGLTSKQCSAKYQAAKEAGTLGDMKWNDFRKAECGPGATAEIEKPAKKKAAAKKDDDDDAAKGLSMKECSAKYQSAKDAGTLGDMKWNDFRKAECGPGATAEISSKAKKKTAAKSDDDEDAGKGLSMKDCSTKYQTAKADGTLGDMKWNDFRKEQCGPGSTMEVESKKSTKAVAKADTSGGGLSMKECSVKYQQAKTDGTLGDLKWNSFRKAKCSADAADDDTVPAQDEATYTNEPEMPSTTAPRGVKFPRGVSSKFSNESEGKARMHTCLEQYYANKENNTLGGLKWIQKGGGYYSLCNTRLKAGT